MNQGVQFFFLSSSSSSRLLRFSARGNLSRDLTIRRDGTLRGFGRSENTKSCEDGSSRRALDPGNMRDRGNDILTRFTVRHPGAPYFAG